MNKKSIRFYKDHEVRAVWDEEKSTWWFSIVDIVGAITDSPNPRKYWSVLKSRLKKAGNELTTRCSQLKIFRILPFPNNKTSYLLSTPSNQRLTASKRISTRFQRSVML